MSYCCVKLSECYLQDSPIQRTNIEDIRTPILGFGLGTLTLRLTSKIVYLLCIACHLVSGQQ